ncbi:MAG: acyl carrier protein [Deltaproteobacteria bacterium]|nr:acyl carrier protein [Deltaproteobacteria bacterium]
MEEQQVFDRVVEILRPFAKNPSALASVSKDTSIMKDLKVNSARFVDVVLELEDHFGIAISDDDTDSVNTVGDAVSLVMTLKK